MRMNYGIVVALAALFLLATVHARAVALPTPTPTPTPTPVTAAKQSVTTANPTPAPTPTPLSAVKQSGAVVTPTPTPVSAAKQSVATAKPTPAATPTPLSAVKQSGAVITPTPTPVSAVKQSVATANPTPAATPTPLSAVKQSGAVVTATPTPAFVSPSAGSAMVGNAPAYSPSQFDFGEVWDGDMMRKTLHLTTTAAGYVTVQIPKGPFRVAEFREMGAVQLPSKNNPANKSTANLGPIQPVKNRITYLDGQSGPFQWSLASGTDIQIDIAFQPHFNLMSEIAGQKSATMKVTGPGPKLNWAFAVPLRGMFDGVRISALMTAGQKEVFGVQNDEGAYVDLTITGLGTPVQGTIKAGGTVPKGVSVEPQVVTVPAKTSMKVQAWITFGAVKPGRQQPMELVFDSPNGSSKTQVLLTISPSDSFQMNSGDRGDCGVSRASLSLQITSPHQSKQGNTPGRRGWVFLGWNFDVAKRRYVEMAAQSGGVTLYGQIPDGHSQFILPEANANEIRQNSPYLEDFTVTPEEWARIMQGPAKFGCRQWVDNGPKAIVPDGELKWRDGVQGLKF